VLTEVRCAPEWWHVQYVAMENPRSSESQVHFIGELLLSLEECSKVGDRGGWERRTRYYIADFNVPARNRTLNISFAAPALSVHEEG
jgi:hypothetical protein